ncbi:hypothetical protein Syun_010044 [Stephania yunnanensis]|uniref:Spindle pole body-associated protein Vik1/Cik1 microtubule binding domain-containing protein n=1 Tax=Stephania yunnanensis TaxID=152371 RepID=A0AAP0PRF9_9MAGN
MGSWVSFLDLNTMESRTEFEEQKRLAWDLAKPYRRCKVSNNAADKLHKDLYNTILELKGHRHQFSFDKVFNLEESQEEVFAEISQLVQNVVDGHKLWRTILLTPFKLIPVFLHEASHAIACVLTCGQVFYFQNFLLCLISSSLLSSLASIDWKSFGLNVKSSAIDEDGNAVLEWENLPPLVQISRCKAAPFLIYGCVPPLLLSLLS